MAFLLQNWGKVSTSNENLATLQNGSFSGAPAMYTAISATDTVATMGGANYFAPVVVDLSVGDLIYAVGTDASLDLRVTAVNIAAQTVTTVSTGSAIPVPLPVNAGGTGDTSFTAYGVLIGGTTGTNPFQSVALGNAGQVLTSNGPGSAPTMQNANSAIDWVDVTASPQALAANTDYIANLGTLLTFNMPAVVAEGTVFFIAGKGAGGWIVQMNAGQTMHEGNTASSVGGTIASTSQYDSVEILCIIANTGFTAIDGIGAHTLA